MESYPSDPREILSKFSETLPLASANSAAPFVIGTLLAERYRLDRCCSNDPDRSDAVLWRAADQMAGDTAVALRQLKTDAAQQRFRQLWPAIQSVLHPQIPRFGGLIESHDSFWLVREWQEGSTWEALIFAHHQRLDNLTVLVDDNGLQAFGSTAEVASMTPLETRISGFGVDVIAVDGHDLDAIRGALSNPQECFRIIIFRTIKGFRVSAMENRLESHYQSLTDEQYRAATEEAGPP